MGEYIQKKLEIKAKSLHPLSATYGTDPRKNVGLSSGPKRQVSFFRKSSFFDVFFFIFAFFFVKNSHCFQLSLYVHVSL